MRNKITDDMLRNVVEALRTHLHVPVKRTMGATALAHCYEE